MYYLIINNNKMIPQDDFLSRILDFKLLFNISCYIWIIILLILYFIIDNLIDVIIIKMEKK
tara:strand:- start:258 stop:440 length:183 start_codon:yes stop_codon:yes gene_type:complete